MKILRDKKAVLFKLKNPSRITTVIPTARRINGGFIAVPHRPDETRVLRHLGFKVPAPMPIHYKWLGMRKPFAAQIETASFLSMNNRAFCLNSFGTGKTYTALSAFDYLRKLKQVNKALVVAPLSTLERAWADEIFRSFPHLDAAVLYGTREKRLKLLASDAAIYIINADGLATIKDALAKRPDIDLVIVDELAMYRNHGTERWKRINEIVNKQCLRRAWGLTGSPTPNAPTDAWAQCKLLMPAAPEVDKFFGRFRDRVMMQLSQFKWVPKASAAATVASVMQPSIRFTLEDCIDLPPQVFVDRAASVSPEQTKAYNKMLEQLKLEYEGGQVLAANEAVKIGKLLQISAGVAYGEGHKEIVIPSEGRIDVVRELIEESEGKVIIFVPLTGALKRVYERISKDWPTAMVYGETPKAARDQIFADFQKHAEPRVLVANPATMSHGLTLTAATNVIWFSPDHKYEIYEQANARVRRPGQTRATVITHIAGTSVERKVYQRLKSREALQGTLLELIKELS